MSLFRKIFGPPNKKILDHDFGEFSFLSYEKDHVNWCGSVNLLNSGIELIIEGDEYGLDLNQKSYLKHILNNENIIEEELTKALEKVNDGSGKAFVNWKEHFVMTVIGFENKVAEIAIDEKRTGFNIYRVHFDGLAVVGVTVE